MSYSRGTINIPNVTGDIVITAVATVAVVTSITAVYTQSGTVYDTDSLDSLKTDLVVTAHYADSSSSVVSTYTLSGTLTVGTSTITVSYGGKTTTFTVTVSSEIEWEDGVAYSSDVYTPIVENTYWLNGQTTSYNGWNMTANVNCYRASTLDIVKVSGYSSLPDGRYNVFLDASGGYMSTFAQNTDNSSTDAHKIINVPTGAKYFSLSESSQQIGRFVNGDYTITPNA